MITVTFIPTIPHCSMANMIGLMIKVKLIRSAPKEYKIDVKVKEGTHDKDSEVN